MVKILMGVRLILLTVTMAGTGCLTARSGPNIIMIVADDLGYADVGVYGCKDIPTPNIDAIATRGVRFTQGYASHPVCAPSRAGLLSGMYSHRYGFENNSGPEKFAAPNFGLPREIPTLAEKLKSSGYNTALIGKWHLGFQKNLQPNARGFDYFFGFVGGSRSYFPHKSQSNAPLVRNGKVVNDEKEYLTEAFAREAVHFLERSSTASRLLNHKVGSVIESTETQPFFLYLAFNAVHLPMESIPKYEDRFQHISDPKRRTYAGMLGAMDDAVGRVMGALRAVGQEENTLVFFYSDNGGPTPYTTSSNKPLRGTKSDVYEGGIRVPFLMQWTGMVSGNKTYDKPIIAFDCHATALAAASLPIDSPDGKDLIPYLSGKKTDLPHSYLCWRFGGNKAVRMDDWKLVRSGNLLPELYNIREDISEQADLASKHPDKVQSLSNMLAAWESEMKPPAWQSGEAKGAGNLQE